MLTTDSINPSVEDFFPLIDSIDHRSQNPDQNDDYRSIGQKSVPLPIFLNEGKPGNILQLKAAVNTMV
jgi:hypothetical protein